MNSTSLKYFFFFHRDAVDVLDHRYQCLPDGSPLPVQRRFRLNAVEIRALHITPGDALRKANFLSKPFTLKFMRPGNPNSASEHE